MLASALLVGRGFPRGHLYQPGCLGAAHGVALSARTHNLQQQRCAESYGLHTPPHPSRAQSLHRTSCAALPKAMAPTSHVSTATPAAPSPRTVSLPNIQSIKDLTSAMTRLKPKAAGQQGSVLIVLDVDLCDRTLEDPGRTHNIVIPAGLRLRLCNGGLHLPNAVTVVVGPGAELELVGMDIKGRGRPERGLITVEGAGATATLHQCTITGVRHRVSKRSEQAHGLLVAQGGSAVVRQCRVLKATKCGICVQGVGSTATVSWAMVEQCDKHGFAARSSGQLTVKIGIALRNKAHGFYAEGGSSLVAGPGCRSERNEGSGFDATWGGQLVAGEGCYAGGNQHDGFYSSGRSLLKGSLLQAGTGCIAEHNEGCGFWVDYGGKLLAGPGCIARHNSVAGFYCDGGLVAEPGCHAEGNGAGEEDQWVQGGLSE